MMVLTMIFALVLAAAVLGTSVMIFRMGARLQKVEQRAYAGSHRAWRRIAVLRAALAPGLLVLAYFV